MDAIDGTRRPEDTLWRTLVRVDDVDRENGVMHVIVPPWSTEERVPIAMSDVPREIWELAEPDRRFHAEVNTGAEKVDDLRFTLWETS